MAAALRKGRANAVNLPRPAKRLPRRYKTVSRFRQIPGITRRNLQENAPKLDSNMREGPWGSVMKIAVTIGVAVVMPFGLVILAGILASRVLAKYRHRSVCGTGADAVSADALRMG
jgi:hypothetical protein